MFPDAKYIHWVRDPRDCILRRHKTDDLRDFGIPYPKTEDARERRAISWLYQYEIMKSTPTPEHCITVRLKMRFSIGKRRRRGWRSFSASRWARSSCAPIPWAGGRPMRDAQDFAFLHPAMMAYQYI